MKHHVLFIFQFLIVFQVLGQSFEGQYSGELLSKEDTMILEKIKSGYTVKLINSENNFVTFGEITSGELVFHLPLNEGGDLEIKAQKKSNNIIVTFFLEEHKYSSEFSLLQIVNNDSNKKDLGKKTSHQLDEDLIGDWVKVGIFNKDGSIDKDVDYRGKNYSQIYTDDGRVIMDMRQFRDDLIEQGVKAPLFTELPTIYWETIDQKYLIIKGRSGGRSHESKSAYLVKNDTLTVFQDNGLMQVLIRKK